MTDRMRRTRSRAGAAEPLAPAAAGDSLAGLIAGIRHRPAAALWLCAVALASSVQPLVLGFYLDDWSLIVKDAGLLEPFSADLWRSIVAQDPTRPVSVVFRWLTGSVFRDVAAFWHVALLAVNALIVWQIGGLLRTLSFGQAAVTRFRALSLAALWAALPWAAPIRFWPTLLNVLCFLALFLWMLKRLLRRWREGSGEILVPFAVYLAVCLGYEAFYLQFIPVVLLGIAEIRCCAVARGAVLRSAAALATAQALAGGWYLLTGKITVAQKPVVQDWAGLLERNLKAGLPEMAASFGPLRWPAVAAFLLLAVMAAVLWQRTAAAGRTAREKAEYCAWVAGAAAAGALLSVFVFSLGGRPLVGTGVEARGLLFVSFWSALAAAFLLAAALEQAAGQASLWWRRLIAAGTATAAVCLLGGFMLRMRDWHEAALLQRRILLSLPIAEMKNMEPGAAVLCIWPIDIQGAPVFSALWDINSAIQVWYPALADRKFYIYSRWGGVLRWDGRNFHYEYTPAIESPVRLLYLWRPLHGEFLKLDQPIEVRPDQSWSYAKQER